MHKKAWLWIVAIAGAVLWMPRSAVQSSQVQRIAEAIARAEGFYVSGSRAQRNNNPGNLTYDFGFQTTGMDDIFPIFATVADGWGALRLQIEKMLDGSSSIYGPEMTIEEVSRFYTTTQQDEWADNVANALGVSVHTLISEV